MYEMCVQCTVCVSIHTEFVSLNVYECVNRGWFLVLHFTLSEFHFALLLP